MDTLGERIATLSNELFANQTEFGKRFGISSGSMSDVVNGKRKPKVEHLISICGVAYENGYSLSWLLLGVGSKMAPVNAVVDSDIINEAICSMQGLSDLQIAQVSGFAKGLRANCEDKKDTLASSDERVG